MKNANNTPILTNMEGVYLSNIHTNFEANMCSSLSQVNKSAKWHYGRHTPICNNFFQ